MASYMIDFSRLFDMDGIETALLKDDEEDTNPRTETSIVNVSNSLV